MTSGAWRWGGVGGGRKLFRCRFLDVEASFGRAPIMEQVGVDARVPHPSGDNRFGVGGGQARRGSGTRQAGDDMIRNRMDVVAAVRVDIAVVFGDRTVPKVIVVRIRNGVVGGEVVGL